MYFDKNNSSFENFVTNINRIIKIKWEALEEMDISLPKISKVAIDVIENKINYQIDKVVSDFRRTERYDKCFIYPELELKENRVKLMYITENGPEVAAVFNIEESVKFPGVAKSVTFECKTYPEVKNYEDLFDFVLKKVENADIFTLWTKLPIAERKKERNYICPECGSRHSIYVGNLGNHYAFCCSFCDFTGKGRPTKLDAVDEWVKEKNSDFQKARTYHLKHQSFKKLTESSLEIINNELNKISALKRNKKTAFTHDDILLIKNSLLSSVEKTINELSEK